MKGALFAIALVASAPADAEVLSNVNVVNLTKLGFSDQAIISKIKASEQSFDVSTDAMVSLKSAGVSMAVIGAMIDASAPKPQPAALSLDDPDPMHPHAPGVYALRVNRLKRIDATATNQAKTGGIWGYALTGGIASMSVKAAIQNDSAKVATSSTPTFYFFFDESVPEAAARVSSFSSGDTSVITSPSEFTLIHLTVKSGRREAQVGSMNIGGTKSGVMDHDRISFSYSLVRPGVYEVKPNVALKPGQYGFIFALNGGGTRGMSSAKIYDFSVDVGVNAGTDVAMR